MKMGLGRENSYKNETAFSKLKSLLLWKQNET